MNKHSDHPTLNLPPDRDARLRRAAAREVHFEPVTMASEPAQEHTAPTAKLAPLHSERLRAACRTDT